ncbi:sigma factor regulator N-terminal domain-containing protein [Niallia circulans]
MIVRRGKVEARLTNILYSLTILLLIIPAATLGSYLYYGIGNKANDLIDIMDKTIYITKPNVSLEEMEIDSKIGFFNMDLSYDLYKRVGKRMFELEIQRLTSPSVRLLFQIQVLLQKNHLLNTAMRIRKYYFTPIEPFLIQLNKTKRY